MLYKAYSIYLECALLFGLITERSYDKHRHIIFGFIKNKNYRNEKDSSLPPHTHNNPFLLPTYHALEEYLMNR
ncbi:MAG: hypothetical protein WC265_07225 [Dysgonamonadaceae bacterium]